jgi:cytochrome c
MSHRILAIGALVLGGLGATPLMAQEADLAAQGEKIFRRCAACHQVGDGAKNGVGPMLTGVVGRPAGSVEGYDYSEAMQQAGADGLVWDEEQLSSFLENPRAKVEGTKMAFAGLRKEEDRQAVIAYLETFSDGS